MDDSKVALVTGGSRGIGAAIVRRLAADGMRVAFTYATKRDRAEQVVNEVNAHQGHVLCLEADAADPAVIAGVVEHTMDRWGRLDVVVANAGVARAGGIDTLPAEEIDQMIDVNVRGVVHTIRAVLPHLRDGGRIVTIGSVNAERAPFAGAAAYAMTKAAVAGLVRGLARDLGPRRITVNNVQPGPTANDSMTVDGPAAQAMTKWLALPRIGTPEEVSALVSYLAGPEAAFVTGTSLTIDGGFAA
ncbi:SDR family oxidoreductase [Actinoallomurus rhizosphaericola]|uniref:SDR family oxidoreductase n=1 Tax=Actinoallomurus rhizosphaericola TaxID=2952536 RepID=UPI0020925618|nr:SDR family oxidoreductase [Actinoallomurus rhizosphaericola]MCO5996938.1 SDR family oxidoreductase [Actinoallomurus rhizosphaericola]